MRGEEEEEEERGGGRREEEKEKERKKKRREEKHHMSLRENYHLTSLTCASSADLNIFNTVCCSIEKHGSQKLKE